MSFQPHLRAIGVFLATLAFLLLTIPAGHEEAEDAYFYARMTESGVGAELFHRHHLFYLPLARAVYRAARAFGYEGRAFPLLIGLSALSGATAVTVLFISLPKGGTAAAFGLLFSYGFWRYATTVEIYIPAAAAALAAFACASYSARKGSAPLFFVAAMVLSIAALLLHIAATPAVLAAVPLLYLSQKQWRRALLHAGIVTALVAAVYTVVTQTVGTTVYTDPTIPRPGLASWTAWLFAIAAAGHTVVSGNFVFAWPSVADTLTSLSPGRMLHEEEFMGIHAPAITRWLAPGTAGIATALLFWALLKGIQNVRRLRRDRALPNAAAMTAMIVWLAGNALLALCFEASNPEMWLLALPPFWWLLGHAFVNPQARSVPIRFGAPLWAAAIGLLAHNAVGGIALAWAAEGQYALTKTRLVTHHARAGDWVLTADSHSTVTCLQYHTEARVVDGRFMDILRWEELWQRDPPRQVWILREFFDPPPAIRNRSRPLEERREALARHLRIRAEPLGPADRAVIYRWTPPPSSSSTETHDP